MREQGILTGTKIRDDVQSGRIFIDPYDQNCLNPASYDIHLGAGVVLYADWVRDLWQENVMGAVNDGSEIHPNPKVMDLKDKPQVLRYQIDPDKGWVLKPGIGYLMHTVERIHTNHYVPVLDGKSSIGRMFVKIHETAGYCDAGFHGQITLEVTAMHPVRVYPGMRFGQVRFHTMVGKPVLYSEAGHYQGGAAEGAVPSRVSEWLTERPIR